MNANKILLRRKNKVIVRAASGNLRSIFVATINQNLQSLGYTFSPRALDAIARLEMGDAIEFYKEVATAVQDLRGVKAYKPMYPNFPAQVMEADEAELYLNAIAHYFTVWVSDAVEDELREFIWLPNYQKKKRDELKDRVKLTVIDLASDEELAQIISAVISSNTSISETDREELKWYVQNYPVVLPENIPNKEILAFVGGLLPDNPHLQKHIKAATDVLRLAVSMSGGDVSLAANTKFRSFKRGERRALLSLLERCGNRTEDMLRWKEQWKRLGEKLHPREYKGQFPQSAASFDVLRNDRPFQTFNSKVENSIRSRNLVETVSLLRDRAGVFARRLDQILRLEPNADFVAEFAKVAPEVSTPVLIQLLNHFRHRNGVQRLRVFFPKGNVAKVKAIDYNLPFIEPHLCEAVVEACEETLTKRFSQLPSLGTVYIDERFKDYLVPFSQRSASRSLRTLVRGSKVALPEGGDTLRFFIWWKEGTVAGKETGRVDIDLSAAIYDGEWELKEQLSYTHLRSAQYKAYHSGDITSAPNGACEIIDIDIPSAVAFGGRYLVMCINSFTGQPFAELPECHAGWMARQHPNSGEVFEAKTVQDKLDVLSDTRICIPVVFDLWERKAIWADVGLKQNPFYVNNIHGNRKSTTLIGKSFTEIQKPNLYDLFRLHASARGQLVERESEADVVFALEQGVTPFDIEKIASDFL